LPEFYPQFRSNKPSNLLRYDVEQAKDTIFDSLKERTAGAAVSNGDPIMTPTRILCSSAPSAIDLAGFSRTRPVYGSGHEGNWGARQLDQSNAHPAAGARWFLICVAIACAELCPVSANLPLDDWYMTDIYLIYKKSLTGGFPQSCQKHLRRRLASLRLR